MRRRLTITNKLSGGVILFTLDSLQFHRNPPTRQTNGQTLESHNGGLCMPLAQCGRSSKTGLTGGKETAVPVLPISFNYHKPNATRRRLVSYLLLFTFKFRLPKQLIVMGFCECHLLKKVSSFIYVNIFLNNGVLTETLGVNTDDSEKKIQNSWCHGGKLEGNFLMTDFDVAVLPRETLANFGFSFSTFKKTGNFLLVTE